MIDHVLLPELLGVPQAEKISGNMKPSGIITLTTDFGRTDPYAGAVRGVILSINRQAVLVDISHDIPRGSVAEASWALMESFKYFPQGTVHLAVVDPGVGGGRRPIAALCGGHFFVGPDNGLFWPVLERPCAMIVRLNNPRYFLPEVSSTFHGRDIFAPAAAWLSRGEDIRCLGGVIDDPVRLEMQEPVRLLGKTARPDCPGRPFREPYHEPRAGNGHRVPGSKVPGDQDRLN